MSSRIDLLYLSTYDAGSGITTAYALLTFVTASVTPLNTRNQAMLVSVKPYQIIYVLQTVYTAMVLKPPTTISANFA